MRDRSKIMVISLLAALIILTAMVPGCRATTPEVVERYVTISGIYDRTGTAAAQHGPVFDGMDWYFRYVNEKLGGVDGVKIRFIAADSGGLTLDPFITHYKKARDVDKALVWMASFSSALEMAAPMAAKDHMPFGFYISEPIPTFYPDTYYFACIVGPSTFPQLVLAYIYEKEWKGPEKPKVVLFGMDIASAHNTDRWIADYCSTRSIEYKAIFTPAQVTDAMPYVLEAKQWGATLAVMCQSAQAPMFLKAMKSLDLNVPTVDGYTPMSFPSLRQQAGEAAVGVYTGAWTYTFDDVDEPGIKIIRQLVEEWKGPGEREDRGSFYWGWAAAGAMTEVLEKALDRVGYEGLTKDIKKGREIYKETAETLKNFSAGGVTGKISFSRGDHFGASGAKIWRVTKDLGLETVEKWAPVPELRPEQTTLEWWQQ